MRNQIMTNNSNLGLTMALWLAMDNYDHEPEGAPQDDIPIVSVTDLLKPTKALVLSHRVPADENTVDLQDLAAARIGQSIHDAVEGAIHSDDRTQILKALGISENVIDRLRINPSLEDLTADPTIIPYYAERRSFRKITTTNGTEIWISGKFDQVINGQVEDNKIVPVYKYMKMDNSEKSDYALQQGMYRWLNPEMITSDLGKVNFIFKDWRKGDSMRMPDYPPFPVTEMPVQLMGLTETETFIRRKLDEILAAVQCDSEEQMPRCKEEELWKSPDVHKYYKNPETAKKGGRSTKNFDSYPAAMQHKATEGGVGVIVTVPGEVRRCSYCDAAPLCTQRLEYKTE